MILYLDTSAFLKKYFKENGSNDVISLWKDSTAIIISAVTYAETLASIYRKRRESRDNEMPDDIEDAFRDSGVSLLPASPADLKTACSCPDWANPCKHVAGTYYKVAGLLDQDPFLFFELRGITRKKLRKELAATPLGKALVAEMEEGLDAKPEPVASRFPAPSRQPLEGEVGLRDFWQGGSIPELPPSAKGPGVPALLIKKQGNYPPFWQGDNSFIEAMEAIYEQVRIKNKKSL